MKHKEISRKEGVLYKFDLSALSSCIDESKPQLTELIGSLRVLPSTIVIDSEINAQFLISKGRIE